jgi:hypothetical protein
MLGPPQAGYYSFPEVSRPGGAARAAICGIVHDNDRASAHDLVDRVLDATHACSEGRRWNDDVTVMAVRKLAE